MTLLLRYVRQICDHLGIAPPPGDEARTQTYAADTDVAQLASEIDESMRGVARDVSRRWIRSC